jgi:Ala-tRNA(Pro) deacylase
MSMAIPTSVERYLESRGAAYQILTHPTAYTAQEEAAVAHVPGREWAKTVVCFADEQPILAVLPAPSSVDLERLRKLAGARKIRLATEDEMGPLYPECERGAMPPLGPLYGQRVFVDESLAADPEIVFNGGTHVEAIRMRYPDFTALVQPVVGAFARLLAQA